jgi:NAD(P)-dependent dehydrogenase (short-subunit alcohol dehydrogenase family)
MYAHTSETYVKIDGMKTEKKVILITGCSSGFGLLSTVKLSKKHIVYASMRNLAKKDALLKAVKEVGGKVNLLELDVTKLESIETAKNIIEEESGRLDVLINNAGYAIGGFFEDLSDLEIRAQLETNLFGVMNVTRSLLPLMRKNRGGKIINISSIAGLMGMPGLGAYNTSKWAIEGFSESLRHELNLFGIKVVLVEPGAFSTNIFTENGKAAANAWNPESPYYKYTKTFLGLVDKIVKNGANNPQKVVGLIEKIISKKNPKLRYLVGFDAVSRKFLIRSLPFKWIEKVVARVIMK